VLVISFFAHKAVQSGAIELSATTRARRRRCKTHVRLCERECSARCWQQDGERQAGRPQQPPRNVPVPRRGSRRKSVVERERWWGRLAGEGLCKGVMACVREAGRRVVLRYARQRRGAVRQRVAGEAKMQSCGRRAGARSAEARYAHMRRAARRMSVCADARRAYRRRRKSCYAAQMPCFPSCRARCEAGRAMRGAVKKMMMIAKPQWRGGRV